ncbi:tetratricopeptide repeat protein [Bacteroides sp.]|uniref:tetratricopeptide repeat protein n=1 Tax=Bacteroides sp. TaxID=29523 RepID=UPI0026129D18|nr:tetratricopeptide repeat protein [Bacteroides sp.]
MRKFILSFLIWGAVGIPAFSQTYEELSERAVAATEQDSLVQAEKYIMEALKLDPANPHNALLFSNLGTIQRRQRQYDQALESYTMALNIAPRTVPILLNRAALYLELGKDELARMDYALALDLETDNQEALLMRAYIYRQKRDYKAARSDYERLLKLNPLSYNGRLGLAMLEQKEGKYEEALSVLNKMIADKADGSTQITAPLYAVLYVARAGVEKDMQHIDLALIDLEEAIEQDPSQSEAYLMRGQIYLSQKKKELARRDFEKAVTLGVPQGDVRDLLQQCK